MKPGKKKTYYQPPNAVAKVRHRLADGVPAHKLLHYMHDRGKLPKDIRDLAEAAERLDQVKSLLAAVKASTAPAQLSNGAEESCRLLVGDAIGAAIDVFLREARRELVLKTMKEPDSEA